MARISTQIKGDSLFETQLGDHTLTTDPDGVAGPSPPEVLVAALGACVGILVNKYCKRSGINTEDLSVDVEYSKASSPYRLSEFRVDIKLPHADIDGRLGAITRVAEHCPVHQTMCTLEGAEIRVNGKPA
jgi:uncharacterized OsmC-like protein